jgi:hypothetical protein
MIQSKSYIPKPIPGKSVKTLLRSNDIGEFVTMVKLKGALRKASTFHGARGYYEQAPVMLDEMKAFAGHGHVAILSTNINMRSVAAVNDGMVSGDLPAAQRSLYIQDFQAGTVKMLAMSPLMFEMYMHTKAFVDAVKRVHWMTLSSIRNTTAHMIADRKIPTSFYTYEQPSALENAMVKRSLQAIGAETL